MIPPVSRLNYRASPAYVPHTRAFRRFQAVTRRVPKRATHPVPGGSMSRRHTITFWLGMSLCLLAGYLVALAELIAGTRLDDWAERWAAR